jgi:hypothetical protein
MIVIICKRFFLFKADAEISSIQNLNSSSTRNTAPMTIRRSQENNQIATIKLFKDFNEKLTNYKPLFEPENLKLMQRLGVALENTKTLILFQQKSSNNRSSLSSWMKSQFFGDLSFLLIR